MLCLLREMFRITWKARDQLGIEEEDPTDLLPKQVAFCVPGSPGLLERRQEVDKSLDSPAA
jgi:hypothetical protein